MSGSAPSLRFDDPRRPFRFSYFEGWRLQEDVDVLSLWKSEAGGVITLSAETGEGAPDARATCARLAEAHGLDLPRITGDAARCEAVFDRADGSWCRLVVLARGLRLILATYTTRAENPAEEDEVAAIFESLELA
jgi:hypothetical protein